MTANVTIYANTGKRPTDVLLASSARNYVLQFIATGIGQVLAGLIPSTHPAPPPYTPPVVPPQQPQAGVTVARAHLRLVDTPQAQARMLTVAAQTALAAARRAATTVSRVRVILAEPTVTAAKGTVHR